MQSLKNIIKPSLSLKLTQKIPNFLSKQVDANTAHQAHVWAAKTYTVDPKTHVFTTIQEHFGNRLIKSLRLPKNPVIIDVGCFIGEKLWQLKDNRPYLGVGVDISLESLEAAKKIDVYGHKFIAADLENLPFKSSSTDLVMVFDVIEHLTHPQCGFSEISRVLRPNGLFLLHIPILDNQGSLFWFKQKLFPSAAAKDYQDVGHSVDRMLSRKQIMDYLEMNNLISIKTIPYNSFFIHFWDREFSRIVGWAIAKVFRSGTTKKSHSRSVQTGSVGKIRSFYGKYIVTILEILSWPDWILSKLGIANTLFVIARKRDN